MQFEIGVIYMGILIDMIYPLGIKRGGPAFNAVHLIAFFQQELRQIGSVLAGHTGDKRFFHY